MVTAHRRGLEGQCRECREVAGSMGMLMRKKISPPSESFHSTISTPLNGSLRGPVRKLLL
jgi:hypothetical protein